MVPTELAVNDTPCPYQKVTFPEVLFTHEDNDAVKTNAVKTAKNKLTFFIFNLFYIIIYSLALHRSFPLLIDLNPKRNLYKPAKAQHMEQKS